MTFSKEDYAKEIANINEGLADEALADETKICSNLQAMMSGAEPGETPVSDGSTWTETDESCIAEFTAIISYNEEGVTEAESNGVINEEFDETFVIKRVGDNTAVALNFSSMFESEESVTSFEETMTDFNTAVTFPGEVIESDVNGTVSDDKKTVSWNLEAIKAGSANGGILEATGSIILFAEDVDTEVTTSEDGVVTTSEKPADDSNLVLYVGIGAGVLVLGAAITLIVLRKKKENAAE